MIVDAERHGALATRVVAGQRLDGAAGEVLAGSDSLTFVGQMAHQRRLASCGERVTFTRARHVALAGGPTRCAWCGYRAEVGTEPDTLRPEQVPDADLAGAEPAELHLLVDRRTEPGALTGALAGLRAALPGVALLGVPAGWVAARAGAGLLGELRAAGLTGLVLTADDPPELAGAARHAGLTGWAALPLGGSTSRADRLAGLLRLRAIQDETGWLVGASAAGKGAPAEAADLLKWYAVSRLLLDNVPHLACFPAVQGSSLTQLALNFGVDDAGAALAGTAVAGQPTDPDLLTPDELAELIRDAGYPPAGRDAGFTALTGYPPPVPLAERRAEPQRVWA